VTARAYSLVVDTCAGCDAFPCRCRPPVSVRCACGAILWATDTLEDKRRAHVEHVREPLHQAWRHRR
jgi:hypothetical protein